MESLSFRCHYHIHRYLDHRTLDYRCKYYKFHIEVTVTVVAMGEKVETAMMVEKVKTAETVVVDLVVEAEIMEKAVVQTAGIELYLFYHMNFQTVHINVFHSHFEFDNISYNPEDWDQCMHLFLSAHLMMSIKMEVKVEKMVVGEEVAMERVEISAGIKEAHLEANLEAAKARAAAREVKMVGVKDKKVSNLHSQLHLACHL